MITNLITSETRKLCSIIKKAGGEARFVGGCVRDYLLNVPFHDIDFAVNLTPEKVTEVLESAGIEVIPTGVGHGTITAVLDKFNKFELTTLRLDSETDGRHAKVEFTDDWKKDAQRRDLTINALYMDISGKIYDYFGGSEDLKNGVVKFIGNAEDRINEDYLRILRFYRFSSRYNRGYYADLDKDAVNAIKKLKHNVKKLSAERVWSELQKILLQPSATFDFQNMISHGVMKELFGKDFRNGLGCVTRLEDLEEKWDKPNAVRRLACCLNPEIIEPKEFAKKWKLSNEELQTLSNVFSDKLAKSLGSGAQTPFCKYSDSHLRNSCYRYGKKDVLDYVLTNMAIESHCIEPVIKYIINFEEKKFPLSGSDLIELGVEPSKRMGELLRMVEDWWLQKKMLPNKESCIDRAKDIMKE